MQGRARLLARLGEDARDAIDAVLDQALVHEQQGAPTLQGLLAWLGADDVEIKRDPEAPLDAVRLMTVHGAKGLQAPVVVMADACTPLRDDHGPVAISLDNGPELPIWLPSGLKSLPPRLQAAKDQRQIDAAKEACRLLYVALTRAEDLLFIGGALGPRAKGEVPDTSWYASIQAAMQAMGATAIADTLWQGERLELASPDPAAADDAEAIQPGGSFMAMPDWARALPAEEARPPRPLAPSSIGRDDVAAPPPGPAQRTAARRGQALHRLFELLPGQPADQRETLARGWLAANMPDLDADALIATVARVLDDPAFAPLFAADALAEAPIAAVVGSAVIAGSVDRLLVTADEVLVCDFKTGRRVPTSADDVPAHYLAQMGAYAAALRVIFPGRRITAALLFTEGPALIPLADHVLALWHPQVERTLQGGAQAPILHPER
jgi:ATP-dependent helicase/nuclease subunit A